MKMPRYKHDCKSCQYLGQYNEYDLYYCTHTVIARYGSLPEENVSGIESNRPYMVEAKLRVFETLDTDFGGKVKDGIYKFKG